MSPLNYNDDTFTSLPEDFAGHYRIPKGIKTIGNRAFAHCRYLKSIDIPEDVTSIGDSAFSWCTNLKEITIPEGVKSIGNLAFYRCENLEKITIPEGVTSIGNEAFMWCENLKEIIIPEGVKSIENLAFYGCKNLEKITIPEGVTSIGNEAFMWCTNLKEIIIPEGVKSIGKEAFCLCKNLEKITIPSTLTEVKKDFLNLTSFSKDEIQSIIQYIETDGHENKDFIHQTQESNERMNARESEDNEIKEYENIKYEDNKDIETCTIPNGFSSIGYEAFDGCRKLKKIEIPSSIKSIGICAFQICSALTQIEIPSSVTKVGNKAFNGCSGLKRIAILGNSTSIDWPLFENCTSLEKVVIKSSRYVLEKGLVYNKAQTELFECINTLCDTNVVIDPKVRIIHSKAFHNLEEITSITLPRNLTKIEDEAFYFPDYDPEINFIVQTERMEQIELEYSHPFINLDNKCTLTVPIGTGYAYRHHPVWRKFKTINVASFNYGEESAASDSEETR